MESLHLLNTVSQKRAAQQLSELIQNKRFTAWFQPIIDFSAPDRIHYEALIRAPKDSIFSSPSDLFKAASLFDCVEQLERVCLEISCRSFIEHKLAGKLFVNISPLTLINSNSEQATVQVILDQFALRSDRVVIELSEKYPLEDYAIVHAAMKYYRDSGFKIAIDDLGSGYSGLRVWSELKPDYVKIDQYFTRDIHQDPVKREFVRSINEISRSLDCHVIAEGIETKEELSVIKTSGISHGQGFLLGKPSILPLRQAPAIAHANRHKIEAPRLDPDELLASVLIRRPALPHDARLGEAADLFFQDKQLRAIPVVRQQVPVGMLIRNQVLELFLEQYGRCFDANDSVSLHMDQAAVIVEKASMQIAINKFLVSADDACDEFIITEQGQYIGIGQTKKFFDQLNEQQMQAARYSNPLTMLPGNVPIYEWINELLLAKVNFHVAYFDLNYFKPYNDKYGYSRGDQLIAWLGQLITTHTGNSNDRVGHIGGDDFVVIFQTDDWQIKCELILKVFEEQIHAYFDQEDIDAQGIYSLDRSLNKQFFPLLSLAIGVVNPDPYRCDSHHDVSQIASDAKHEAKQIGGNALYVSRRRSPDKASYSRINS